jgi:hypothetical protein
LSVTPDYATRKIAVRAWNFVGYLNELFPYGELEGDEALAMDLRGIVSTGDWDALVARIPDVVEFITDHVFGGLGERINPDMLTLMVEFVIEMEALMQGNELEAVLAAARQVVDAGPNVRELATRALANALTNHEAATKRRATRTRYRIVDST